MTVAEETPSALAIRLFGPVELLLHGTPLPRLRTRKGDRLLALLVLRRGAEVERSWLAGTLWPNSSESEAYASLRVSLSHLRGVLGPEAGRLRSPTPHTLSLDLAGAQADVAVFDAAIAQRDVAALEQAISLYRGPLLEGCAEEWAFQERQTREQAYLQALETLAAAAMTRGDPAAAAGYLGRAVAVDPLRESAQRGLMQALARSGNYAAALLTYRELRLRLHRELNAAPDPETQALFQQLRAEARGKAAHGSGLTAHGFDKGGPDREPCGYPRSGWMSREPSLPTGTVTFLFTDIEGSSRLWEQYPEAMKAALAHHDTLLRQAIQSHGGLVFKTVGDAFYTAFATAPGAVAAALAAQQVLLTEEWGETGPLRVRMALHTGIAEARAGDYFGSTLNRVSRLLDAAHGSQILLSLPTEELVQEALPEGASLRPLGEHRLKDLVRPEHVFQLLHPDLPSTFPPLRSLAAFTHNLPLQWTSFVGRDAEMAELKRLLSATPLLTLTGPGGCGKTRLALQVAADLLDAYPDGVWLVELASLEEPSLVPQAVATALGVIEQPGRPLTATLIEHLRSRSLLLLLDNCEHLLAACSELVDALLRACPYLRLLATSRERLGLTGERIYLVPSLSLPPAVDGRGLMVDGEDDPAVAGPSTIDQQPSTLMQSEAVCLFVERAVYSQPQFALTEQNAVAVIQICRQLEGIPLALELAAARVKALPVEQLAARLDDAFRLLTGGSRTALPRQQTLRALIDWSYDLLSEAERALLRRLSVFAGGWSLEAAEAVCSGGHPRSGSCIEEWEILDLLTLLVEKSLVQYEEAPLSWQGRGGGEGSRYRLLETVRQYAGTRLAEAGETASVRGRHRDWFLALAERAAPELRRSDQLVWLDRLQVEHDNLRAALEGCLSGAGGAEAALRLATALEGFWITRGFWREGQQFLEGALTRGMEAPAALRARTHAALAQLARFTGENFASLVWFAQEGLDQARTAGDRWAIARLLFLLGMQAREKSDFQRATALGEQSLAVAQEVGDPWLIAQPLLLLGMCAWQQGEHEHALWRLDESLTLMRSVGDRSTLAVLLTLLGNVSFSQERFDQAVVYWKEGMVCCHELRDLRGIAWGLFHFPRAAVAQGQAERAARLLGAMAGMLEDLGLRLPPGFQTWFEETTARARTSLDEAAFQAAWAEGRAMTREQAVAYALEESSD